VQYAFPVPLKPAPNVLSIGLSNTNMILHCPTMIMNAGRIESEAGGSGFTPRA
jgi:opine dehydrogenase